MSECGRNNDTDMPEAANSRDFGNHLLGIRGLNVAQCLHLLDTAEQFIEVNTRTVKKVPSLRGKTIINLFLEPSTRTRTSFEIAGKRLSADTVNISGKDSSVAKGETFIDTAWNLEAMHPDAIVLRHPSSGAPHLLAAELAKSQSNVSIINAGDGLHEHPTQALLDLLTIRQTLGRIADLKIAIVGDALRGRVAKSNILLHSLLGNEIRLVGPSSLVPDQFAEMGVTVHHDLDAGIEGADVVMTLRPKFEYLKDIFFPNLEEYAKRYCLTSQLLKRCAPKALVLSPGPIMRGIEIASDVADGLQSGILRQVENGVAVRMAVLFLLVTRVQRQGGQSDVGY